MAVNEQVGKYRMVRHVATGGMAEIWLAEQDGPGGFNKQLVLKRILPHLARDQHFTQMFLDEARTVAQLTHPNIVQIFELGEVDGDYFIAMEYIEGVDVSVLGMMAAEKGEHVPIKIAVKILIDALRALDYAHDFAGRDGEPLNLVHRDVTPHNLLVSNDGAVKLVDFGVAKAKENQSKTETGAVKGKYAYMAPEQISSSDVDRRVDVFAAGVVLQELLTGERPFGDDLAAINAILTRPPKDVRELRPDVSVDLAQILSIAMQKETSQRYQSADMFASDLEEYARVSNQTCTNRELADFVRGLQGIALSNTGKTKAAGPRATLTEREVPVDAAELAPGAFAPTAEMAPVTLMDAPVGDSPGASTVASEPSKGNGGLVAVFSLVMLLIVGVGGGGIYVLMQPSASSKTQENPQKASESTQEPSEREEKANPKVFAHDDGNLVVLSTDADAKMYYKDVFIGRGRMTTNLRKGTYTIVVKKGGKVVSRDVTVGDAAVNQVHVDAP